MDEFVDEPIEVQQEASSPRPRRFKWRGQWHEVAEVVRQFVDTGFGEMPPRSRKWYTRRHRRHYILRDRDGGQFHIYLDYSNRARLRWILVNRRAA